MGVGMVCDLGRNSLGCLVVVEQIGRMPVLDGGSRHHRPSPTRGLDCGTTYDIGFGWLDVRRCDGSSARNIERKHGWDWGSGHRQIHSTSHLEKGKKDSTGVQMMDELSWGAGVKLRGLLARDGGICLKGWPIPGNFGRERCLLPYMSFGSCLLDVRHWDPGCGVVGDGCSLGWAVYIWVGS
ncbi:hypothetical protein BJ508DRAFT_147314 [Ascobolus immersus RN42]|uniref:Uncharacterized protein n=1 Tax=Ascobolus immersus RN42 TaxID=1160509 RepID=A0A3N4IN99_ASCIM|nr:hypothetical protein BJ508DRAFT_147314 [Ascobolus immersus RN42]